MHRCTAPHLLVGLFALVGCGGPEPAPFRILTSAVGCPSTWADHGGTRFAVGTHVRLGLTDSCVEFLDKTCELPPPFTTELSGTGWTKIDERTYLARSSGTARIVFSNPEEVAFVELDASPVARVKVEVNGYRPGVVPVSVPALETVYLDLDPVDAAGRPVRGHFTFSSPDPGVAYLRGSPCGDRVPLEGRGVGLGTVRVGMEEVEVDIGVKVTAP